MTCLLSTLSTLSMAYIVCATVATTVFVLVFILQQITEVIIEAVDQYNSTYGALMYILHGL